MLNAIIGFSIRNKLLVGLFVLALILVGLYEVTRLPIDAVPDITNNQVQVITVAPSFGTTDIERLVTFPVEQSVSNIPGLKELRSFSRFGLSLVTIVFDDDCDIYLARQQVSEKLQQVRAQIPPGIGTPELGPVTTGLGEIYQYTLKAKRGYESRFSETELRTIQDWQVRRQLLSVKGVAEVSSFGGKLKQYSIEVVPSRLEAFGISIADVLEAIEKNNQNTGGAYIEKSSTVLFIRTEGLLTDTEQIKNTAIKQLPDGTPLYVRDVANVVTGYAVRYGALMYNDEGEVAGGVVMMLKGANSSEVIRNVKEKVATIRKTLPEGVELEPFLDRTKMVNNAITTVEHNLEEGALIVVFVLVLFLGNFRAGLLVASVIPLAMLFAVIMMNLFGVGGNLMSLGALDFGLIVDGAVIIVEAVLHQLAHGHRLKHVNQIGRTEMDDTVKSSAGKMMNSAVFGQIIILVVYLPIFSLQGIEGKMFRPMAQTVAFALLGAFLLSLTYIPMMSSVVLSKRITHKANFSDKLMGFLERGYNATLRRVMLFPKTVLAITVALFGGALWVLTTLGGEFIPTLEEGDFAVETRVLTGSSLNTTIEATQKAAHILKSRFPEVEKVVTKIGSGEVPTDPMPMEACDMIIVLKDKKEWTTAHSYAALAAAMGEAVQEVPGITTSFQFPVQMRFNELMTGAKQDVVCKIYGEDLDTLASYAQQLGAIIGDVKGTKDLYVETVAGLPQIVIRMNRNALAQYNLNVTEVNHVINASLAGQECGAIYEGEKRFGLVVRLAGSSKKNLSDLQNLLVTAPNGRQVPLDQLATVALEDGPYQVQREEGHRRIIIGFNARGRDVQSIVTELQQKVDARMKLPAGYSITFGGVFENLVAAKQRLLVAVPISLALIFLLLFFAFNNMRHALLIYSAIPLSAIGGIFFLALRGMPFSISAGVGFIALFGVAVLNGIVLIAEFNRLSKEGGLHRMSEIILKGTSTRLRPVLMTAFVASLGFLPMALSNGAGAEVQRPLATVVIGGLLLATLLTLFVLPILYLLFGNGKKTAKPLTVLLLAFLVLSGTFSPAAAQQSISLTQAIDTAMAHNLSLKVDQLTSDHRHALLKTAVNLPNTSVTGETGQYNSKYTDTRITVGQTFSFPTVYTSQRNLLKLDWQGAQIAVAVKQRVLKRDVTETYYLYAYLLEKKRLLVSADSLYSAFVERATLRLNAGESNVLEQTSAATQLGNIKNQLQAVNTDLRRTEAHFNVLLGGNGEFVPAASSLKMPYPSKASAPVPTDHPLMMQLYHQQKVAASTLRLERARLLPDIGLQYNNTSIRGIGADERLYQATDRFQSVQLSLGLPIWGGAQRARIRGAAVQAKVAEAVVADGTQQLAEANTEANLQYQQYVKTVHFYETEALPRALLITQTANSQLQSGSLNYLEWAQLINQSIGVQNDYLDAVKHLNETIIQLQYYIP